MDQYIVPFPDATDPALLVCGGSNVAVTYPENNLICFCPAQFNVITTFAELPKQPTLDPLSPDMMDAFRTISGSFLHEYTHIIGRLGKLSIVANNAQLPNCIHQSTGMLRTPSTRSISSLNTMGSPQPLSCQHLWESRTLLEMPTATNRLLLR